MWCNHRLLLIVRACASLREMLGMTSDSHQSNASTDHQRTTFVQMAEFLGLYQLNEPGDRDPRQVLHPMRLQIQPELFGPCLTNMHSKGEYEPKVEEAILIQSVVRHESHCARFAVMRSSPVAVNPLSFPTFECGLRDATSGVFELTGSSINFDRVCLLIHISQSFQM